MTNATDTRFLLLATLVACLSGMVLPAESATPPNFVVIFVDDLGYRDLGCYGSAWIDTPHIDRMAEEGMRFTSFYAQNVCAPSRAALLTGCYPIRVAEPENEKNAQTVLHSKEITLAELLGRAGYATGCVGKWHLAGAGGGEHGRGTGPYPERLMPNAQGFDHFFGTPAHNGFTRERNPDRWKTELRRNGEVLERDTSMDTLTKRETEAAVRFIERNRDEPFFLYLSYNMVHVVLGASEPFRGTSGRGLYGDAVREVDHGVGRVLDTLERHGLDEQTLVLLASDNGPWVESHLREHGGSAHPLRGFKMSTWEGGPRVPGIVRWPGHVEAGRVTDEIVTTLDVYPTFAKLAGVDLPDRTIDGKDMSAFWLGERETSPRSTFLYYSWTDLQAVRRGRWKLVLPRPRRPRALRWYGRMTDAVPKHQLYDLKKDVAELHDVAADHPKVVAELKARAETARRTLGDHEVVGEDARFFDPNPPEPGSTRKRPSGHGEKPVHTELSTGRGPVRAEYQPAIEHEPGVSRRDPSDVIRHEGTYYVWYTKVGEDEPGYPSGYPGVVWYATSPDGKRWTERGRALPEGKPGRWDAHGVFTPNILRWEGRFYLFYTGVPEPFSNEWKQGEAVTPTRIGVAVAESPAGPWERHKANPVLEPALDRPDAFDSLRVDDAALVVREGKVWLYYKGRSRADGPSGPAKTRMGAATAAKPTGSFEKLGENPLHRGHEVLVWPQSYGVGSMATAAGPKRFYYAYDGVRFAERNPLKNPPDAPGIYRVDRFRNPFIAPIPRWGISHRRRDGDLYLQRFDLVYPGGPSGK